MPEDTQVEPGDVIIGKCMPQKTGQSMGNKDTSIALKSNERGYVDCNCYGHRHFTNVTGDGYTFAKVRLRQERVPTIGDKVSCYTSDHDVLTEDGWVPVGRIDAKAHRVASLLDDGSLAYQTPAEVQSYSYRGPLISVKGEGIDLLVTPEHRMWLSRDGLEYSAHLAVDTLDPPGGHVLCALKALPASSPDATAAYQPHTESPFTAKLGRWIAEASQAGDSRVSLPAWMCRKPTTERERSKHRALLSAALYAGGSAMLTRSSRLADQLQQIALQVGFCCDLEQSALGGGWLHVRVADPMPDVTASEVPSECVRRVYCCTVPSGPGVIYVRRAGRAAWCGNSRHGQKGTIGMLYREEDMPFTSSGIVPSLIINPHAIPSRMTIGQLMEALECKAGGLSGAMGDATPFNGRTVEDIAAELEALGAERYGNEIMYNPRSGEQVACSVFVCPTYYQRLKHMVEDKVHSRAANGPVVLLTRQPAEGRARDGGLRLGEMELECLWAHGSMYFLKVGGLPPPQTPPAWARLGCLGWFQGACPPDP